MNIKLRAKRVERGYNQKQLADKLHINLATYSKKENGINAFTLPEIIDLLEILDCNFEDIFFRNEVANKCEKEEK